MYVVAELRAVDVSSSHQFEEEIGAASSENGLFIAKMEFSVWTSLRGSEFSLSHCERVCVISSSLRLWAAQLLNFFLNCPVRRCKRPLLPHFQPGDPSAALVRVLTAAFFDVLQVSFEIIKRAHVVTAHCPRQAPAVTVVNILRFEFDSFITSPHHPVVERQLQVIPEAAVPTEIIPVGSRGNKPEPCNLFISKIILLRRPIPICKLTPASSLSPVECLS